MFSTYLSIDQYTFGFYAISEWSHASFHHNQLKRTLDNKHFIYQSQMEPYVHVNDWNHGYLIEHGEGRGGQ